MTEPPITEPAELIDYGRYLKTVDQLVTDVSALKAQPALSSEAAAWCIAQQKADAQAAAAAAARKTLLSTERNNLINLLITAPVATTLGFVLAELLPRIRLPF